MCFCFRSTNIIQTVHINHNYYATEVLLKYGYCNIHYYHYNYYYHYYCI